LDTNITIIGAGVVGLAIAAQLSEKYKGVYVLEKNQKFGQETSSRNSEVIHSGIYYPTNSLKAKLCVRGNAMLYNFCNQKNVSFNKCGKIMVATSSREVTELEKVLNQSQINGVTDGVRITANEIKRLEPNINALEGLFFPSTGVIDSHGLMKQLLTDTMVNGGEVVFCSEVVNIKKNKKGYQVEVNDSQGGFTFTTNTVINSAGLWSDRISELAGISDPHYKIHFWKGEYFSVGNGKNKLVNRLIYPVPLKNTTGLGIHATIDLNKGLKLGPNAIYLDGQEFEYSVDKTHLNSFYESAKTFFPFLEEDDLRPDQAGIRPKLQKPGDTVRDFVIKNEADRGFPNFINLIGIESPGLTSCLSIAEYVRSLLINPL
jgi:L-2-hydroxyglutarate oxidase LhgO